MGLRMAYWFGFAAVAGAFGGLVAFGVQQAHSHVADWKILFIIEVIVNCMRSYAFSPVNKSSTTFDRAFRPFYLALYV
jgi:hypothetical protein